MIEVPSCRFCSEPLITSLVNLGMSPLSNAYLKPEQCSQMEPYYPLQVRVCNACFLVQLDAFETPEEIFSEYAYFSSFSDSWLAHARAYVNDIRQRFELNADSLVIELASNDGYLLQYFHQAGIPVLGIEPALNIAEVAREKGVETRCAFFGSELARQLCKEGKQADLIVANNVLAHVPQLNDFVAGIKILLAPQGLATLEFPHLLALMEEGQFDTIYHEHFSYFSLTTVIKIFAVHGLHIVDVEELSTHGGSLRIYAAHQAAESAAVQQVLAKEKAYGLLDLATYTQFQAKVQAIKNQFLSFIVQAKETSKTVVAYGAPAKGNTFLNYVGIGPDYIDFVVDRNPYKQGLFLPGTHIPILEPAKINEAQPDYLLILPWNLKGEIMQQMKDIREWGGKFVIAIPQLEVL